MRIVTIGWPMATPRLNYFRDLLWWNPSRLSITGIVFESRLTPALHGVPIIELGEVTADLASKVDAVVLLTLNTQLRERAQAHFNRLRVSVASPSDVARMIVLDASSSTHSPFDEIDIADVCRLASGAFRDAYPPLSGLRTLDIVQSLESAWHSFKWEAFFDWTTEHSAETPFRNLINAYFERGVSNYFVGPTRFDDFVDFIVHFGALHRSSRYIVWTERAPAGSMRAELHASVLGSRLKVGMSPHTDCILVVANSVAELRAMLDQLPQADRKPTWSALVRLGKSLLDLSELAQVLNVHGPKHQVELDLCSADPSQLTAHVFTGRSERDLGSRRA